MLLNIGCITALLLVISLVNKKHLNIYVEAKVNLIQKTAMHSFYDKGKLPATNKHATFAEKLSENRKIGLARGRMNK